MYILTISGTPETFALFSHPILPDHTAMSYKLQNPPSPNPQ